jgi:UDP-N-acetylmuramoyl-tripeptide--D-alanyl-D-alanine ligase
MDAAFGLLRSREWEGRPKILVLGDMLELGGDSERLHLALCEPLRALLDGGARIFLYGGEMGAVHRALPETEHLPRDADPRALVDQLGLDRNDAVVLVKGSRGMRLERVVEALTGKSQGGGH